MYPPPSSISDDLAALGSLIGTASAITGTRPSADTTGLIRHFYSFGGVTLECLLDYQPAEREIINDFDGGHPGSLAAAELISAHFGGVDLAHLLRDDLVQDIQESALREAA